MNARVAAMAFPGREGERAEVAERLVEIGRESGLSGVELAGHQLACRLRLQLFDVRAADAHAREARVLADRLGLPLPAMQQRLWDCSRRALDGDVRGALRMVDEVEQLDWPWWGRDAMIATVRLTLLLRAGSYEEAAPLLDFAARVNPGMAADARVLVSHGRDAGAGAIARSASCPRDWTWLASGCIHAQSVLALGDHDAIRSSYEMLLPGSGMIASTGSFDAGPVDGYLADLAAALGRPADEHVTVSCSPGSRHARDSPGSRRRGSSDPGKIRDSFGKDAERAGHEGGHMTITGTDTATSAQPAGSLRRRVASRPIAAFTVMAFTLGWPLLALRAAGIAATPAGYAFTYVALLGSALTVTWAIGGRPAVLRFLSRYLIWRLGVGRWALVVLGLPMLTVAVAAASGTLHVAGHDWAYVAGAYLLQTFVTGALEVNLAEEGAWSGLVQTRFAERSGLLGGALRTAPLFVAMHLPLQFTDGWTWGSVASGVVALAVIAPFFRYLIGETLEATGGSLLAAGILHASFNACGSLGFPGGWQFLPALLLLTIGLAVVRRVRKSRSTTLLHEGEIQ